MVVALQNIDDLGKSVCVKMCFTAINESHSDSDRAQKELNQTVNLEMFNFTVDSFAGKYRQMLKLTCPFIGVLCVYFIIDPIECLMFMDPVNTVQKNLDHFRRSVARRLV